MLFTETKKKVKKIEEIYQIEKRTDGERLTG